MSFLDRIKGNARAAEDRALRADTRPMHSHFEDVGLREGPVNPMESTVRIAGGASVLPGQSRLDADSSIISEAAPSELAAEYPELPMGSAVAESAALDTRPPARKGRPRK